MASRFSKWRAAKVSGAIRLRFKTAMVEKIPLFAGLSERESQQIARTVNEIEIPAGTRLATVGERGGELFAIVDGEAVVTTKSGRTSALKTGDFFGEMSLIDGEPRSATVDAASPMRLLVLEQKDFWSVLDASTSIVRKVMHTLCQRVRKAEADIQA